MMDVATETIVTAIREHRLHWSNEEQLQAAVEAVLTQCFDVVDRERELSNQAGRVDFFVPLPTSNRGIGVEVKTQGSPAGVVRQLLEYADAPEIDALVLVTGRQRLGGRLPETLRSKPLRVVSLWRGAL